MELAMIGLGRMGSNMTRRLLRGGHHVVAFDLSPEAVSAVEKEGATGIRDLGRLRGALAAPRTVWVMVPAGEATEATMERLEEVLEPGDLVIDGGNSWYRDSVRRAEKLGAAGLRFLDVGVSGGVWGLENGYSLMAGGASEDIDRVRPVLETLAPAPDRGWGHVGAVGSGHFAKMVHNGIEYGLMQAYAEGFEILKASRYAPDLKQLCDIWSDGSVVRSWLLTLAGRAFAGDPELAGLEGFVPDSGEGRWTLAESVDLDVPAPVLYASLMTRFRSRQEESFQAKVLAALRREFGGHAVKEPGAP